MDFREYIAKFEGLDTEVTNLKTRLKETQELEKKLKSKKFVQKVLRGLTHTGNPKPRESEVLYHFVSRVSSEEIIKSNFPGITYPCHSCGTESPVLAAIQKQNSKEKEWLLYLCTEGCNLTRDWELEKKDLL